MNTYIILKSKKQKKLPNYFIEDGRFDTGLLKYLIKNFTNKKSKIIDPFAGYGTTIIVSEKLKRKAWGIEINKEKYLYANSKIKNQDRLLNIDAINIGNYYKSYFDVCITSPTYSWKNMGCNPLNNNNEKETYQKYLQDYKKIIIEVLKSLKSGGLLIIDTANIDFENVSTTLAWDIKYILEEIPEITFKKELIVCWKKNKKSYLGGNYGFGYDHSYCLIFKKN